MATSQRFYSLMALFFGVMTVICTVRVLTCGGGSIWYVPPVLGICSAATAVAAVRENRKKRKGKQHEK